MAKKQKQSIQTDDVLMPWEQAGAEKQSEGEAEKSLFDILGSEPEFAEDGDEGEEEPEDEDGLPPDEEDDADGESESEDEDEDLEEEDEDEFEDEDEDEDDDFEEDEDSEEEEDDGLHVVKVDGEEIEVSYDELLNGYSRTEYLTRTRQKEAEEHRSALAEVQAQRAQYAERLEEVEGVLNQLTGSEEPDWDKIEKERPQEFPKLFKEYQQRKKAAEAIKAEREKESQALTKQQAQQQQEKLNQEFELLQQAIPEWKDPVKMKEGISKLASFAVDKLGFTQEELNQVYDHRILLMLQKAHQADQMESKGRRKLNQTKRKSRKMKPGGRKRTSTKNKKSKGTKKHAKRAERVARSGSVHDAARLFDGLLEDEVL